MGFRAGCYPRAAQTESSNWQYQLIFLICYNTGKKGKSATWTLAQIRKTWQPWNGPDFPVSIGSGVGVGRRYFAFAKTGSPPGFLCVRVCVGGTKGQAESRSSVVFSRNQKPSFPLQANLEKKCPTWRQGLSSCWGRPEVDLGNVFEWRPAGVPLKPERWTEEMRACPHKREGDCVHSVAKITSVPEQPRHTHTRMSGHTECHV